METLQSTRSMLQRILEFMKILLSYFVNNKMEKYFFIIVILLFSSLLNMQKVQHISRFRNFTIESETDSIYLINMTIFQYEKEHRVNAYINLTKDVEPKALHVTLYRCIFEKAACEYFQTWKMTHNIKGFVYMKNQMWTPMFSALKPRLDFPVIKKNIYIAKNATMNADAATLFYPEVVNYYWKIDAEVLDINAKKAMILKFEIAFVDFVERDRKRRP